MAKVKKSKKQKTTSASVLMKVEPNHKLIADKKLVVESLMDAFHTNDAETFKDVLLAHLRTLSKPE